MHVLLAAAALTAAEPAFPTADLLPKSETGIARFLAEHPTYDGRGIVVAIFDTGVDPGAPGLQVTTDGKPKIIDVVDGSGSGDVSTKTVRRADQGKLAGLSGRTLDVGSLTCPSGEFHLGVKPAFELWPSGLVGRMKEKRQEQLDEAHGPLLAEARRALEAFDDEHPEPTEPERLSREELAARVDVLRALADEPRDPGPVYDCVVFHDGEHWRAAVDTDEDGDLTDEKAMASYRVAREWSTFDEESLLNYAVNIYEEGDLLSIVTDCGAHGTHVAGIVAAHHPEDRALDGMAPGAQLVCVKIGDTRLGASSTNTGPVRGLITALADSCRLINMSFGGSTPSPDEGRIVELYQEIVNEHGVVFVLSAGNSGPALSTVGSAGGTTSHLMGIGAYLSGDMMTAQYSIREKLPDTHYTWSSRGPTADGDLGVALSAPGGAFSPVPNWELKPTALLNGTSMAAPSVCGGIACLLSGAAAEGIATSPHDIRRALEATAEQPEGFDPWTLGRGLARFDRAWEVLRAHRPHAPHGVRFEANVPARDDARGVYLREPEESSRAHDLLVEVAAVFADADSNRARISFERHLRLESSAPWVDAPQSFVVVPGTRSFKIKVDPRDLPPGVHFAEVRGTDSADPGRGPLFRVPVTVIRSERLPEADPTWRKTLAFGPGQIRRFFFAVPDGATWADLVIRTQNPETPRQIVAHAVQLVPGSSYAEWNTDETQWLDQGGKFVKSFAVAGGRTLELCLAQNWSNLGSGEADFELSFHGLAPHDQRIDVDGGIELSRPLLVRAALRPETIAPKAEAKILRKTLLPEKSEVRALDGSRDLLPEGRQVWEAVLTYEFELDEDAKVRPRAAVLETDEVWQSWQSMLWQIHDEGKRLAANGPKNEPVSLPKGKYTLRFHVRSIDEGALRALRTMPLALDRTLDDAVTLRVLEDPDGALEGGHEFGETKLARGATAAMWIAPPPAKSVPKGAAPGDLLVGTLRFGAEGNGAAAAGDRPSGWPLTVRLPSARVEKEATEGDGAPEAPKASSADELAEELLQVEVDHLAKLRKDGRSKDFEAQSRALLKARGRALPLLVEHMRYLAEQDEPDAKAVVRACDEVVHAAAGGDLARLLGERADLENEEAKAARERAEKRRDALVEALRRKVEALAEDPGADAEIAAAYAEVARWTDPAKGDAAVVAVEHERRRGRPAKALEILNARIEEAAPERALFEQRLRLLEALGWTCWVERERRGLMVRFPESYPPF